MVSETTQVTTAQLRPKPPNVELDLNQWLFDRENIEFKSVYCLVALS